MLTIVNETIVVFGKAIVFEKKHYMQLYWMLSYMGAKTSWYFQKKLLNDK